jgi:Uncharacterized protein conserved in bacteria
MNWSKCKSIFIYFFLIIDVLLFSILVFLYFQDSYIPKKEVDSIHQYLSAQKIQVSDDVIPRWVPKMKNIELLNVVRSDSSLVTQFNKNSKEEIPIENKTYKFGKKSLTIDNNHFLYVDDSAFSGQRLAQKDVTTKVKIYLTSLGFDMTNIKTSTIESKDGIYTFSYQKILSKMLLGEAKLTVTVGKSGSLSASGIWFNPIMHDSYTKVAPRSVIDILVLFSRDVSAQKEKNVSIKGIHLFYHIDSIDAYHRTFTASSTWEIETKNNKTYFYDARS